MRTLITKTCQICGAEFQVPLHRKDTARYCSKECASKGLHAKPNVVCTNCGKEIHIKKSQQDKYSRNCGYFCSRECFAEYRKTWFRGDNNHQYGLKGHLNSSFKPHELLKNNNNIVDIYIYAPEHPHANKNGRVTKHRYVVEQNHEKFNKDFFENINGRIVLKEGFVVHHKDNNHNNNELSNLEIMTRGEHSAHHNKENPMPHDTKNGRFISRSGH